MIHTYPVQVYIPGAAAPGYLLMKMMKIVLLTSRAAIGLGGHQSKKKSIWRFRNFSRWFLKEFMHGASTASWERLFHLFMMRWEKKWWRISDWWCDFVNFQLMCPRVLLVIVGWLKNCPRNSWKTLQHLEKFNQISPIIWKTTIPAYWVFPCMATFSDHWTSW